ncbi:MAG: reverse transcriptase family protein [Pseudomonadota bacterium]
MRDISYRTWITRSLARALLADADKPGGTRLAALQARAVATLGENPVWLASVIAPLAALSPLRWQMMDIDALTERILNPPQARRAPPPFGDDAQDDEDGEDQEDYVDDDLHTEAGLSFADGGIPHIRRLILRPAKMRPRPLGLDTCVLPDLPTVKELAQWLDLPLDRLLWLSPETPIGADHYRYKLQPKRTGGLRLLEIPKADLKRVQRAIHSGLLQHVPVHEAAHGFVTQRSVATHAAAHAGRAVVIKFDLKDFFGSIRAAQVAAVWRTLGYPVGVARCLATLCTHRTAQMVVQRLRDDDGGGLDWWGAKRLRAAHLPQGAPTSPTLANLCAFGLDLRLDGLAWAFGATYTRYADDLVFSGPEGLRPQFRALQAWVAAIAEDEGFALHPDKTRCLPQHRQQRITGVVVNARPNTPRQDYDKLKACLHQCVLHGPTSQNHDLLTDFRGHLLGRIAWVKQFNAARATKLMGLFVRIVW